MVMDARHHKLSRDSASESCMPAAQLPTQHPLFHLSKFAPAPSAHAWGGRSALSDLGVVPWRSQAKRASAVAIQVPEGETGISDVRGWVFHGGKPADYRAAGSSCSAL
jgi:hypothetical protein